MWGYTHPRLQKGEGGLEKDGRKQRRRRSADLPASRNILNLFTSLLGKGLDRIFKQGPSGGHTCQGPGAGPGFRRQSPGTSYTRKVSGARSPLWERGPLSFALQRACGKGMAERRHRVRWQEANEPAFDL